MQYWLVLCGTVITAMLGQYFMIETLQHVEPTVASALRTLDIVLAFALQITIMNEEPSSLQVLGVAMVILGVFGIPSEAWLLQRMKWN